MRSLYLIISSSLVLISFKRVFKANYLKLKKLICIFLFVLSAHSNYANNNIYLAHSSQRTYNHTQADSVKSNKFKSKFDIDNLIKTQSPLFTIIPEKYLFNFRYFEYFRGIKTIDRERFKEGFELNNIYDFGYLEENHLKSLNRGVSLALFPIKKINDYLVLCVADISLIGIQNSGNRTYNYNVLRNKFYIINLKIAEPLDEISEYPTELNFYNPMLCQIMNNGNIGDANRFKCLFTTKIKDNRNYVWKNEFILNDLIYKKLGEVEKFRNKYPLKNEELKIEFRAKLDEYDFSNNGFKFELGKLNFLSQYFKNFPFDIDIIWPQTEILLENNSLELDNFSRFGEAYRFEYPDTFDEESRNYRRRDIVYYRINETKARQLVESLNSNREILITIKLKMLQSFNINLCGIERKRVPFTVTFAKIEPIETAFTSSKTLLDYYKKTEIEVYLVNNDFKDINSIFNKGEILNDESFIDSDLPKTVEPPKPAEDEIFTAVEQQAEFPGGPGAFRNFLQKNLRYPPSALAEKIGGKVYVQFVVNTDGTIENVQVLKSVGYGCDLEAVRLIKSVPRWNPGKQSGRLVRSRFTQPILFVLPENNTMQND
jgi:TonB family protein